MAPCHHVQWLRLKQDQSAFTLHNGHRLQILSASLRHPSTQFPSVLYFVGRSSKSAALRFLYAESRISHYRHHGVANICLDSRTTGDVYPVYIADSSLDALFQPDSGSAEYKCHETTSQLVEWSENKSSPSERQSLIDLINARLFSMFIDVLCIFAEDCGGLINVATKLNTWASIGSASSLPKNIRPRVVIVTRMPGDIFEAETLHFRSQISLSPEFNENFSSLNIVNIVGKLRSSFGALKEVLAQETEVSRRDRIDSSTLFSSIHLASFFDKASNQFAKNPESSFDFIQASRDGNNVNQEFDEHIGRFLSLCLECKLPDNIYLPFIASAILLDSFPPEMHLFDPSCVFRTLYKSLLLHGIYNYATSRQLSSELIGIDVETLIIEMFIEIRRAHKSAFVLRKEHLRRLNSYSSKLKTTQTCLYCLIRKPEHVMDCAHTICDVCVDLFGEATKGLEYRFDISNCLLCQGKVSFQARLMPPTCRPRLISIDGGGSRGIVPLEYLDALQDTLGLPYPIQEHFDYGIGTSTGGIVIIGLWVKYWGTKKCLAFFHKFAKNVFPPQFGVQLSRFAKIQAFFASYFRDARYDASYLEDVLRKTFGTRPLFDSVKLRPSGMKIAVTATTISNATLCLFSNYNGNGGYHKGFRCKHLRALSASDEILIWEAARCTTAAPWYFKPKFLEKFGTFQDGAMKYNNPVRPGLRGVQRVWGDRGCDLVLSIGTGFKEELSSPKAPNVRNLFQDGMVARFYRASISSISLDAESNWQDHWHGLGKETKGQHFRLNLPLKGKEPDIDDVDQMPKLQFQVRHHLGDLQDIARAIISVSFFFELNEPLVHDGTIYRCHGSILSRSPNSRADVQILALEYPYARFATNDEKSLGYLDPSNICEGCGRFQKEVTFSVRHPSEVFNLYLVYNRLFRRNISGSPQSGEWFEKQQKFNALFGRADHKPRVRQQLDSDCSCIKRRQIKSTCEPASLKRGLTSASMRRSRRKL